MLHIQDAKTEHHKRAKTLCRITKRARAKEPPIVAHTVCTVSAPIDVCDEVLDFFNAAKQPPDGPCPDWVCPKCWAKAIKEPEQYFQ